MRWWDKVEILWYLAWGIIQYTEEKMKITTMKLELMGFGLGTHEMSQIQKKTWEWIR